MSTLACARSKWPLSTDALLSSPAWYRLQISGPYWVASSSGVCRQAKAAVGGLLAAHELAHHAVDQTFFNEGLQSGAWFHRGLR
jgi:hypothetical protein